MLKEVNMCCRDVDVCSKYDQPALRDTRIVRLDSTDLAYSEGIWCHVHHVKTSVRIGTRLFGLQAIQFTLRACVLDY